MTPGALRQWAFVLFVFLGALAVRVAPGWDAVYGDGLVDLQGGDAYYHLRSIETLVANFPWRSGFDPYALYPGGQNVPTGPLFDYVAAGAAMALGLGDPSPGLVRAAAAWVPPLFGALAVLPAFLLGRALAGPWFGLIAAAALAVCPGHNAIYGKLGFADHHVFETLFYACLLAALATALTGEEDGVDWPRAGAAGVALGLALLNRPAAAFVGATIGAWAMAQTSADLWQGRSPAKTSWNVLIALLIGWCFLLPAGGGAWGALPHILMAAGVAAVAAGWVLAEAVRRLGWPAWAWPAGIALAAAVGVAATWIAMPDSVGLLRDGLLEALLGGDARLVAEVRPLVRESGRWTLRPLFIELGPMGLIGLPVLALMGATALRTRDRALSLAAGTGLAFYGAALIQARMSIYAAVNLAAAAGWFVWYLAPRPSKRGRVVQAAALAILLAPGALLAWVLNRRDMGMSDAWREAAGWLRTSTPDPLGDGDAFLRHYPRLAPGETFAYPPGAYGVLTWWDLGYWVLAEGRRTPVANGTQAGAKEAAAVYTSTDPASALEALDAMGARYVIVDDTMPVPAVAADNPYDGEVRAMTGWTGAPIDKLFRVYEQPRDGGGVDLVYVFYPEYFRMFAIRLYLHDGEDYEPRNATTVFSLRPGKSGRKAISSKRLFETFEEAQRYLDARKDQDLILGTLNPYVSCATLEAVPGLRQTFNSAPGPVAGFNRLTRAVKIFERTNSR